MAEAHLAAPVAGDRLPIDAERRAAGGQAEHTATLRGSIPADHLDDAVGEECGEVVVLGDDHRAQALTIARAFDGSHGAAGP